MRQFDSSNKKRDCYDWATLGITVLGLFGLGYYAYWAKVQAVANGNAATAAKESADAATAANGIAQQALQIAQRAIINIERVQFGDFKKGNYKVSYIIHNTGHLPATGLQTFPSTFYGPSSPRPAPVHGRWLKPDEQWGDVIGPGEEWPYEMRLGEKPKGMPPRIQMLLTQNKMLLTESKIADAVKGKLSLQVVLVASYFDGFKKPRTTWRVYTWDPILETFKQASSYQE